MFAKDPWIYCASNCEQRQFFYVSTVKFHQEQATDVFPWDSLPFVRGNNLKLLKCSLWGAAASVPCDAVVRKAGVCSLLSPLHTLISVPSLQFIYPCPLWTGGTQKFFCCGFFLSRYFLAYICHFPSGLFHLPLTIRMSCQTRIIYSNILAKKNNTWEGVKTLFSKLLLGNTFSDIWLNVFLCLFSLVESGL